LAEHRPDVLQPLALDAPPDGVEHLSLHVLCVHNSVRTHTARQARREPAGPGADVGYVGAVGDAERVHDLIRLLPGGTIGRFEQPEILRRKQLAVTRWRGRLLRARIGGRKHEQRESQWQA
jgi:hypothetical protein